MPGSDRATWRGSQRRSASAIGQPSALTLQGVVSRQKFYENDRLFYEDNMPTFVTAQEAFVRLNYGLAARTSRPGSGVGGIWSCR